MPNITLHKVLVNHNEDNSYTATLPGFYRAQDTAPTEAEALNLLCSRIMLVLEHSRIVDLHVQMPKKPTDPDIIPIDMSNKRSQRWKVIREPVAEYHVNTQDSDTLLHPNDETTDLFEHATYKVLVVPHQNQTYTASLLVAPDIYTSGHSETEALDALHNKLIAIYGDSRMVELEVASTHTGQGNGKPRVHRVQVTHIPDNRCIAYTLWLPEVCASDTTEPKALEKLRNKLVRISKQHVVELAIPAPEAPHDPWDNIIGIADADDSDWAMVKEAIADYRAETV